MHSAPAIVTVSPSWIEQVADRATLHPLLDTQLSREGLRVADPARPPRMVYLGLGLCARDELSKGIPLDLLGLLLPAEEIRQAAGATELLVLIADRHALENEFPAAEVEARAAALEDALRRIRHRCGLRAMSIVRASSFHGERAYRDALAAVRRRAGDRHHDYALRQFADAIYLEQRYGGLLKVGWALRGAEPARRRDEVAFDLALREIYGDRVSFVYCKPGRSLADESPRVPPYVVTRPDARLCIDGDEDAAAKLERAYRSASPNTVDGYRRHLRALVYTYCRAVERLPRGPLEERVAALTRRLAPTAAAAGAPLRSIDRDAS
jgi:hypothetical protein